MALDNKLGMTSSTDLACKVYMKGVDHSYYEGDTIFKTEEL